MWVSFDLMCISPYSLVHKNEPRLLFSSVSISRDRRPTARPKQNGFDVCMEIQTKSIQSIDRPVSIDLDLFTMPSSSRYFSPSYSDRCLVPKYARKIMLRFDTSLKGIANQLYPGDHPELLFAYGVHTTTMVSKPAWFPTILFICDTCSGAA